LKKINHILFSTLLVLGIGCGSTPCSPGNLQFGLIGFSDPESNQIILRKYDKGSYFTQKIDSVFVTATFSRSNDTLTMTSVNGNALLWSSYEYEIVLPLAGRIYRISNIQEEHRFIKHSLLKPRRDGCINPMPVVTINQQETFTEQNFRFYLKK
jgi:hypothetical protein